MNLIGIPRVSTGKQQNQGDSIQSQELRFKNYCNERGYELIDIWNDDAGKSASMDEDKMSVVLKGDKLVVEYKIKSRPALSRVLNDANSDKFDGIIFFKWDRLFRSPPFAKAVQIFLESRGKKLIPTDDPEDPFASDIVQLVSKYEVDKMKARVREVRKFRFEQGIMTGRSPFGYMPIKRDKKVIGFKPNPKEAEVVKKVFEMTITGVKYNSICKELKLMPQQYYNIIRNPVYCGYIQFEGITKKGTHEPIISEEDFRKLNPDFKV